MRQVLPLGITDMTTFCDSESAFRKVLTMVIGAISKTTGFDTIEKMALETLLEMITSYVSEAGNASKLLAEASGRTEVIPTDINLALSEMGFNFFSIIPEAQRQRQQARIYVPPPKTVSQSSAPKVMKIGKAKSHQSYIPEHLPAFPDPHTYVNTDVNEDPDTNYQQIREIQAEHKRNIDFSLVNFMGKIHQTQSIFPGESRYTLLCPEREEGPSYVSALVPDEALDSSAAQLAINSQFQFDNPFIRQPKLPLRSSAVAEDFT